MSDLHPSVSFTSFPDTTTSGTMTRSFNVLMFDDFVAISQANHVILCCIKRTPEEPELAALQVDVGYSTRPGQTDSANRGLYPLCVSFVSCFSAVRMPLADAQRVCRSPLNQQGV
jgi:hypothetical protein